MRCKNCGADNDDNRYICEVCGSPLYDESDFDNANGIDDDRTQTFKAVNEPNNQVQNRNDNYNDYDKENQYNNQKNNESENKHKGAEKKSIIVIAVLAVILIAIIASVAAIAHNKNKDNTASSNLTKISTQSDSTSDKYSTTEKKHNRINYRKNHQANYCFPLDNQHKLKRRRRSRGRRQV